MGLGNTTVQGGGFPNRPVYDEQLGMTFASTFSRLDFNVTAVAQDSIACEGPAYLLNGVSDKGYWYQTGVAWRWTGIQTGPLKLDFIYEVFGPNATSIFPVATRAGIAGVSVNPGDSVLLSMSFSNGSVTMSAHDWNTSASRSVEYSAYGASEFLGSYPPVIGDLNGFFTGLMTEQYHDAPFYGAETEVTYSSTTFQSSIGNLWVDEQNGTIANPRLNPPLFILRNYTYQASETLPQSLSFKGANEVFDGKAFTTGQPGVSPSLGDCNTVYWIITLGSAVFLTGVILMVIAVALKFRAVRREKVSTGESIYGRGSAESRVSGEV